MISDIILLQGKQYIPDITAGVPGIFRGRDLNGTSRGGPTGGDLSTGAISPDPVSIDMGSVFCGDAGLLFGKVHSEVTGSHQPP
jgi:hypothetical protein